MARVLGKGRRLSELRLGRWLVVVLGAVAWAAAVWIWPGLHLGDSVNSRGLQPAVLIAVASIQAAVVVFALAVGAIVLQVMVNYSWVVVRSVLPGWLAPVLAAVVGVGVVFPLWVSFSPTGRLSTAAFVVFGWSMLAVGATVWEIVQRMNPPSLSVASRQRAVAVLSRPRRRGRASDEVAEVLGQLVADAELPYEERLRLVGSYVMVLADQARGGLAEDVAVAVRALGERAVRAESVALAVSIARALWVLGLDQAGRPGVFGEVHSALTAIGRDARRRGQREIAAVALDALAGITVDRVGRALRPVGFRVPPRPRDPLPPPARSDDGLFPLPVFPSSSPPNDHDQERVISAEPAMSRRDLLNRFVQDFAAEDGMQAGELAAILTTGLAHAAEANDDAGTDAAASWRDYDLLDETAGILISLLPSPQPASTGWPSGWQGHGTFDADIQRLAGLADRLYQQSEHVPVDLVEAALEEIGVRLRAERPPPTDLPAARTGWRYPPARGEAGGIAAVTASCLGTLMGSAFDAGFDRRALSTGLRILASATASASAGDVAATAAYADVLGQFTVDKSLHGLEARSQAGCHRAEVVLIGLIAECDQLINAAREQKEHHREIYDAVESLTLALAWNMPNPRVFSTVIAMLQTRLAAAGWPVDLPSGQRRVHESDEPVTRPAARPLSGEILSEAEELFSRWLGHGEIRLPTAALMALWAHAACAARDGALDEVQRIAALLTDHLHAYAGMPAPVAAPGEEQQPLYQPLDPGLRRLVLAAVRWCKRADPLITPTIPRAAGPRSVQAMARWLAAQPDTANWIYRGDKKVDEQPIIIVEMPDRSRRVLRDAEVRTGDLTWGYYGSGPHDLATVLLADILADHRECPDCLGAGPLAAGMIRCRSCSNTGRRPGTRKAERRLLATIIGKLPEQFERNRLELLSTISGARETPTLPARAATSRDAGGSPGSGSV